MTEHDLEDSIKEMEKKIRESQIVMLPGGFSGGCLLYTSRHQDKKRRKEFRRQERK